MLVNQKFIADKAGVSQKTVSLYFKDKQLLGPKSREKISEVVQKYRYIPNMAARSIQSKKFNRIGCVVVQYGDHRYGLHPHLLSYMNGINTILAPAGYSMIFEPVYLSEFSTKGKFPEFFDSLSIDGIIGIQGTRMIPEVDERIMRMELPTVWLNRKSDDQNIDCIYFDEYVGIHELARYMTNKGFKRIAWFGHKYDQYSHYSLNMRHEALKHYLDKYGGKITVEYFTASEENPLYKASLLARRKNEFDAAVCYTYQFREAVTHAATMADIKLTEYPVFHFASNWEKQRYFNIHTTVMMPEVEIGQCAAQYILKKIAGEDGTEFLTPLPTRLDVSCNEIF